MTTTPPNPTSLSSAPRPIRPTLSTRPGSSLWHFLEHQFQRYRTTWRGTIVSGLVSPILFLLSIGFGLGSQIDDTSSLGTTDYASFVGPGVLAGVAMIQGANLGLWPTLGALKWEGTYQAVLSTPLTAVELATGHVLWIGFRVLIGSSLYVGILALFGIAGSWTALLAPVIASLTAMAFAAPVSAFAATQDNDNAFSLIARVVISPLFLFSGAFFPTSQLPVVVEWLAAVIPVSHGVELCRHVINGETDLSADAVHLAVILTWLIVGWVLVTRSFSKRLSS